MIAWAGLLGKILEFTATKLIGTRIDLALDDKKRAGSYFMRLYLSVSQLEIMVSEILSELQEVIEIDGATLRSSWLASAPRDIAEASERFLNSFRELSSIIAIYDPDLSKAISSLQHSKQYFMTVLAPPMQLKQDERGGREAILIRRPSKRLIDLVKQEWNQEEMVGHMYEVSQQWLDAITEDEVGRGDKEKIKELYEILKAHLSTLENARARLREFIATKFSMEDLLHVRKLDM
ncbi:MAG: hypothetical protein M3441_23805 [Chloroflexota bacterium]|nr:hypothetical protein [Chloroflexota bacterium]